MHFFGLMCMGARYGVSVLNLDRPGSTVHHTALSATFSLNCQVSFRNIHLPTMHAGHFTEALLGFWLYISHSLRDTYFPLKMNKDWMCLPGLINLPWMGEGWADGGCRTAFVISVLGCCSRCLAQFPQPGQINVAGTTINQEHSPSQAACGSKLIPN